MERTSSELAFLDEQGQRLNTVKVYLDTDPVPLPNAPTPEWLNYLLELKSLLGHTHNSATVVATMLAKDYLGRVFQMRPFEATAKKPGRPGLDIDEETVDGRRVVAEVKTTTPYMEMGSNQKKALKKDLATLDDDSAEIRNSFS